MAIAYGAALIAAQRAGSPVGHSRPLLQRMSPADLGVRVHDPRTGRSSVDVVVPRNTPLPASQTRTYYTHRADQSRIVLEVIQLCGPDDPPLSLGHFAFPISNPRKNHPLEVTLAYDQSGIAKGVAREPDSGSEARQEFASEAVVEETSLAQRELLDSVRLSE